MNTCFLSRAVLISIHQALSQRIRCVLKEVRAYGQAVILLKKLEEVLLIYFERQSLAFYYELKDRYAAECETGKMVVFLQKDLEDLKVDFLELMEKYQEHTNPIRMRNFPKDFLDFSSRLKDRMALEYEYLMPLLPEKK